MVLILGGDPVAVTAQLSHVGSLLSSVSICLVLVPGRAGLTSVFLPPSKTLPLPGPQAQKEPYWLPRV